MKKKIFIEGNIGSGKTTLCNILDKSKEEYNIVFEPVEKWRKIINSNGKNLLQLFYEDQKRWSYTFQSIAFITRIKELTEALKTEKVCVMERSVYTDMKVFAINCYESGMIDNVEWELYKEWFNWLVDSFGAKPEGIIYVRTDTQNCLERIKKRDRQEEAQVPIEYLEKIHKKHEDWLLNTDIPIYIIDGNLDFEKDKNIQDEIVNNVINFIKKV